MHRNRISLNGYSLSPVTDFTVFAGFSCGHEDLDDFLHNDAQKHSEQLLAISYALCLENGTTPIAFTSLLNDSAKMDRAFRRKMPRVCQYSVYPAVKIGRFGVRVEAKGQGVGRDFLDCIKTLFLTYNRTGCRLITVDAYTEATGFYQRCGFRFFTEDDQGQETRSMFFDLARFRP
ncbi:GNAT family N-acetyltransferase [Desulfovibrio sp. OttesenSCG-928-M16]|nr:GNAT family N-acetyltransferase [Desulfovibrio sp. OttesenSCG-928-M16]